MTTGKLWEEYKLLKATVQNVLNEIAAPDKVVFSEMRRFFAYDFLYFNQILSNGPFVEEKDAPPAPSGLDIDVRKGLVPGYNVILSLVKIAGLALFGKGDKQKTEFLSVIDYYQKKDEVVSSETDIGTLMAMREDLREKLKL